MKAVLLSDSSKPAGRCSIIRLVIWRAGSLRDRTDWATVDFQKYIPDIKNSKKGWLKFKNSLKKFQGESDADLHGRRREPMARVESSNVVVSMDDDDRINQLSELLDKAIQECEEIDGLLTLYAVELSSLNDDITLSTRRK
ncbi:Similar to hypothetical protein [Tuber melanosporum Mel28]; acc. no. XP_002836603 [Pyronema omphalodes CBS 100304]|uniref:Exocyst complex component Sec3 coiled-coil domain-containing protein n=1 Tax=Pyronema omphalodes (strain CBS 100304) TaxID=1076935 RepID=U4LQT0_PYROM|nr:Similar to hypothetical protein [Tuber melanosporum Mel28]; acc. no. XP_002836603 [Pyronema omphalodes CBS 100304]